MDTVLVDPGDEILFLRRNLGDSELSADGRFLYNYNRTDHALEKIDLDELKLVKKIPFEKEGPQGTGPSFTPFFLLGEDSVLVAGSLKHAATFNLEGEKLNEVKIQQLLDELLILEGGNRFLFKSIIPGKSNQYLGFLADWSAKFKQLLKADMANSKLTELDLPAFDKLEEYNVVHVNGGGLGSQVLVKAGGEKIIISNNAFNELYVYLPESDSLILKTYESRLTPDQKTPYYPKQVDSDEALYRIYAKGLAEITFEPLIWDKVNERFYRFSYQTDLEVEMENGRQFESVNNSNIYLTVFDKNLEMLAESGIPELSKVSDTYFVKDGAIWIFENMEDELGFVRLRIDL